MKFLGSYWDTVFQGLSPILSKDTSVERQQLLNQATSHMILWEVATYVVECRCLNSDQK